MKESYVIYDNTTGAIAMMIQTDNPDLLSLNTPEGCKCIPTSITNLNDIARVDPENETIILAGS